MEHFEQIKSKLEAFIRKFYWNQIIKGSLLFLFFGLLYFLLIAGMENVLWLSTAGRAILFWTFIAVEIFLIGWFILIPLLKLFKLKNGLNEFQASEIIGKHFPNVDDKLKNLLQLKSRGEVSDLLAKSIEQKSLELNPVPFSSAVNFKTNYRYLRLLVFPVLILSGIFFAGKADDFFDGFSRITDYNTVYNKPAPFQFILPNDLNATEGEDYILRIETIGKVVPENIKIRFDEQEVFMKKTDGFFEYTFPALKEEVDFSLISNDISSEEYKLRILKTPKLEGFEMTLDYPAYTGMQDETLASTGNATIPQGTKVTWQFYSRDAEVINYIINDSVITLSSRNGNAVFSDILKRNRNYAVNTSNENFTNFQPLNYEIKVIPDEYPNITIESKRDSLNTEIQYFKVNISDDYGLNKAYLEYYPSESKDKLKKQVIPIASAVYDNFVYTFPGDLDLEEGTNYDFYFRVYDNDQVNGAKSVKSETFTYYEKTASEVTDENLENQNRNIQELSRDIEKFQDSKNETDEFQRLDKEEKELNFDQRKKLNEFIQRRKQQNEMMKNYSEDLRKNVDEMQKEDPSEFSEQLQERMDETEKKLQENEELLKQIQEYTDKLNKEELGKKLEELSKSNRNTERNLEQLLELTKRYYIEEKKQKLASDLEDLGEKQENLAQESENSKEKQEAVSKKFDEFQKQMDRLEKENADLKQPKDLNREKVDEETIKKDQEDAEQNLENGKQEDAQKEQKNAGQKMKEMAQTMKQSSQQMQMQQLSVDSEVLRQILDNLIVFSFNQEDLMGDFNRSKINDPQYANNLKRQNILKENFEFIDDSLYALALRNPMLGSTITDKVTDVQYNIEQSLDRLGDNQIPQGISSQQYVITGSNELANMLSDINNSMQNMMSNPQAGQGQQQMDMQLQDIIEGQQQIGDKIQKQKDKGKMEQQGSEENSGELYQIYQEQQRLRMKMEELLEEQNGQGNKGKVVEGMEEIEKKILNNELDEQLENQINNLNYELMKFQDAEKTQGRDSERESETNKKDFKNTSQEQMQRAKDYFQSIEILNRQILPLRPVFKEKVKNYFGAEYD